MKRKALFVVAAVLAILVVTALALPFFFDADTFRPRVEEQLQTSLARPVKIGRLRLSLLAGGVTAENIAIADDAAFSAQPFLEARSLDVGVDLGALIFSKALHIRSLTVVEPRISLVHTPAGKWNFASLSAGTRSVTTATPSDQGLADFSMQKLRVLHGRVGVAVVGGKEHAYEDVNLEASDISYTSPIPFTLDANTPGGGRLRIEGHAGPIDRTDASRTPLQASVNITGMDLARTGFVSPDSGIAGMVDYNGTVASDGKSLHSEGTAKAQQLRLVKTGAPARDPVSFAYASDYDLKRQSGALLQGELRTGNSLARVGGNYDARGESVVVHMKVTGQGLPVQDLSGLLPALGVTLPAGSSLEGGSVTANLALDGALERLVTTGQLDVSNLRLAGFNLGSKMTTIAALAGVRTGSDTTIQTMSSKLRIAPEGIRADSLSMLVAELGTVTGAGTVGANNALNFRLVAKLTNAGVVGNLTRIAGLGQSSADKGIPFRLQGTTSNPVFVPDVGGMVGNTVEAPAQGVGGLLGGFFGKKKKQ
jgi:AsmA protein